MQDLGLMTFSHVTSMWLLIGKALKYQVSGGYVDMNGVIASIELAVIASREFRHPGSHGASANTLTKNIF